MGSVESAFQFISYKVDSITLEASKNIESLSYNSSFQPDQIEMQLRIRNPIRFKGQNAYVGGLEISVSVYPSKERSAEKKMVSGDAGIAGLFKVVGPLTEAAEKNLVLLQIPTILFPYLRSALSMLFLSAGYPGIVFPLINVQQIAKDAGDKIKILDAEQPEKAESGSE